MSNRNAMTGILRRHGGYLLLLAIMLAGSVALGWARHTVRAQVAEAEEAARPGDVVITLVTAEECERCFDATLAADHVAAGPVRVTDRSVVEFRSDEGAALVAKYGLTKVPAVLVTGETDKANVVAYLDGNMRAVADGLVWDDMPPVYLDVRSGEPQGLVSVTLIDDGTCEECYDPTLHTRVLENNFGMTVADVRTLDVADTEARDLIERYGIADVPTMVVSPEATVYRDFVGAFMTVGDVADDGSFVFRRVGVFGKYLNLASGTVIDPSNDSDNSK